MICHKHKCIFIHIAKCAGTSVENAFGFYINTPGALEAHLGWDEKHKLYRQHATPQQLIDLGILNRQHWDSYYKFIIYRNSWSKLISDFFWISQTHKIQDSFENFLLKRGKFFKILNNTSQSDYCGDHLYLQKDYFFLDGDQIKYDTVIDFNNISEGFYKVIKDLNLNSDFFAEKRNAARQQKKHYSHYYTLKTKRLVQKLYLKDINYFNFKFINKTDRPMILHRKKSNLIDFKD